MTMCLIPLSCRPCLLNYVARQLSLLLSYTMSQTLQSSCGSEYFGPATRLRSKEDKSLTDEKPSIKLELASGRASDDSLARKISKRMNFTSQQKSTTNIKSKKAKLEIQWEPANWKDQFENIRLMRKDKDAPVDTMGCERCTKEGYTEKVSVMLVIMPKRPSAMFFNLCCNEQVFSPKS